MAVHTPTRRPRTRQHVKELEAQAKSAQEKQISSTHLPGNADSGLVEVAEAELLGTSDIEDHPDIKSESPLLLSPPGTSSTAPSPGTRSNIWDSPLPSSHHLSQSYSHGVSTPLTPPSSDGASPDSTPAPKARKAVLVKTVEEGKARDAVATLDANYRAKTILSVDATLDDDCEFKPQKLIRNLTKELLAITNANAVTGQPRYNLRFNLDFAGAAGSYTSAQPHYSRVTTEHDVKTEEDSKSHTEVVYTVAVDTKKSLPRTRKSSKPLHPELEHIVPISIQSRAIENPGKCVASFIKRPHERCTAKGPGAEIDIISRKLSKCDIEDDPTEFLGYIEQLVQAAMCRRHQNSALSSERHKKLTDLVARFSYLKDVELAEFQAWIDAITSSDPSARVQTPTVHISPKKVHSAVSKTVKTRNIPATPSAAQSSLATASLKEQVYLHGFTAYQPKHTQGLSVSAALLEEIVKPLTPTALKYGFIYIFWEAPQFGAVKIGRTNDLARRLKEWNRNCKRKHMYHPASQRGELSQIPHVSRIEQLIHIELKDCRKQRWCGDCGKTHKEWFGVEETLVTRIFRKWHDWIVQKPYALDEGTKKWVLRPEMMDTLAQVCEPVAGVEKQLPPLRRARGAKGRGKGKRQTI